MINKVNDTDLVVFGFPSNSFGHKEPAANDEILDVLKHVRPGNGFVPLFPLMEKGDINGANGHPVFETFLKVRLLNNNFK